MEIPFLNFCETTLLETHNQLVADWETFLKEDHLICYFDQLLNIIHATTSLKKKSRFVSEALTQVIQRLHEQCTNVGLLLLKGDNIYWRSDIKSTLEPEWVIPSKSTKENIKTLTIKNQKCDLFFLWMTIYIQLGTLIATWITEKNCKCLLQDISRLDGHFSHKREADLCTFLKNYNIPETWKNKLFDSAKSVDSSDLDLKPLKECFQQIVQDEKITRGRKPTYSYSKMKLEYEQIKTTAYDQDWLNGVLNFENTKLFSLFWIMFQNQPLHIQHQSRFHFLRYACVYASFISKFKELPHQLLDRAQEFHRTFLECFHLIQEFHALSPRTLNPNEIFSSLNEHQELVPWDGLEMLPEEHPFLKVIIDQAHQVGFTSTQNQSFVDNLHELFLYMGEKKTFTTMHPLKLYHPINNLFLTSRRPLLLKHCLSELVLAGPAKVLKNVNLLQNADQRLSEKEAESVWLLSLLTVLDGILASRYQYEDYLKHHLVINPPDPHLIKTQGVIICVVHQWYFVSKGKLWSLDNRPIYLMGMIAAYFSEHQNKGLRNFSTEFFKFDPLQYFFRIELQMNQ